MHLFLDLLFINDFISYFFSSVSSLVYYYITMLRLRSITDNLSYDSLLSLGVIPDLYSLIVESNPPTKRYPPFVYSSNNYPFFGMLWDYIIRASLRINLPEKIDLGIDPVTSIIPSLPDSEMLLALDSLHTYQTSTNINLIASSSLSLTSYLFGLSPYSPKDIQSYIGTIINTMKELMLKWSLYSKYLSGPILFNSEYSHSLFSGHPDIVTSSSVLDIKSSASFLKLAKSSCLQILAYYALIKPTSPSLQYVGFVLPIQRDLLLYNVGLWDPLPYLDILHQRSSQILSPTITIPRTSPRTIAYQSIPIGSHISKGKNIANTLRDWTVNCPGLPCQFFLGNPRTGKKAPSTSSHISSAAKIIKDTGLLAFIHAPYVINLCSNQCDETGTYWQQNYLNEDLAFGVLMGCKGVVVHTGARKTTPEDEALKIMEHMVRTALPYASESCPLLLETPCREGTEVCCDIQELGTFFLRFSIDERKKLGLCHDFCHTFSAGYDPLPYLMHWEKYCQTPIRLIHFNDSKGARGCCRDNHAVPGEGHIGMEKMMAGAIWCNERNIPMVRE